MLLLIILYGKRSHKILVWRLIVERFPEQFDWTIKKWLLAARIKFTRNIVGENTQIIIRWIVCYWTLES